jgi:hypothetical protein
VAAPTLYTDELFDTICDRIAGGEPLEWICADAGMPKPRTVRDWYGNNVELDRKYLDARKDGCDAIAADILRIADTPIEAEMVELQRVELPRAKDAPADAPIEYAEVVVKRTRKDALEHRKLRIDARFRLLKSWDARYAERLALEHNIGTGFADQLKAARERAAKR